MRLSCCKEVSFELGFEQREGANVQSLVASFVYYEFSQLFIMKIWDQKKGIWFYHYSVLGSLK